MFAYRKHFGSEKVWYNNIIVAHAQKVESKQNGYTGRPYSMKLFEPDQMVQVKGQKSVEYANLMSDNLLLAGYSFGKEAITLYPPSPEMRYSSEWSPEPHETGITLHDDGTISVYVSKESYRRIGVEVTYHELCQSILIAFSESIKAFAGGDEKGAVELLGGSRISKTGNAVNGVMGGVRK
jgi:hypothetical protein